MRDLVTILIAAFDAQDTISRALGSCLAQTHRDLEVVVVDDGSTDGTAETVSCFARRDSRVRLLSLTSNAGPSRARNLGLAAARGRFIAVMDADDAMAERRLERLVAAASSLGPEVVLFDQQLVSFDCRGGLVPWRVGNRLEARPIDPRPPVSPREILRRDLPAKPFFSRSLLDRSGARYPEDIRFGEDLIFLLLLTAEAPIHQLQEPLYYYRLGRGTLSSVPGSTAILARGLSRLLGNSRLPPPLQDEIAEKLRGLRRKPAADNRSPSLRHAVRCAVRSVLVAQYGTRLEFARHVLPVTSALFSLPRRVQF